MSRLSGGHDVDRDLPEVLQEVRVAQTGGQLFFAFLFSVAFAPGFQSLTQGQRTLYAWDLFVVASAVTVLVAPVAVHQGVFGRGLRPALLVTTHVLTLVGLALSALGLVLGLALVASVAIPDAAGWLPAASGALLGVCWVGLPILVSRRGRRWRVWDSDSPGPNSPP